MPPHCDTRDGPVVKAAIKALETGNLNYVLLWIPKESENELKGIFEKTQRARKAGKDAQEVADDWFFREYNPPSPVRGGCTLYRYETGGPQRRSGSAKSRKSDRDRRS